MITSLQSISGANARAGFAAPEGTDFGTQVTNPAAIAALQGSDPAAYAALYAAPADALQTGMMQPTSVQAMPANDVDGIPPLASAGNVLRPKATFKLSVRVPPTADAGRAAAKLKQLLEKRPPYGAKVTFAAEKPS